MVRADNRSEQQLDIVAAAYGLGRIRSCSTVTGGTTNKNFEIVTDTGSYFVRCYKPRKQALLDFEHRLYKRTGAQEYICSPLTNRQGGTWLLHEGRVFCVFPWLKGQLSGKAGDFESLGRHLAQFHDVTSAMEGPANPLGAEELLILVREFGLVNLKNEVEYLSRELELIADSLVLSSDSAIHGDLFPDNVMWSNGKPTFIDFEQSSVGDSMYDLGVVINAWCFAPSGFDRAAYRSLITGYEQVRGVNRERLMQGLRLSACRFTVTRIRDIYIPGLDRPDKNFREFLKVLRYWQDAVDVTL